MPKIKDLGINIVPGTMRPPEIGGGGGGPNVTQPCKCITAYDLPTQPCTCMTVQCGNNTIIHQPTQPCTCMTICGPQSYNLPTQPCTCMTEQQQNAMIRMADTDELDCVVRTQPCSCITDWDREARCPANSQATFVTPQTPNLAPGALSREDIAHLRQILKFALGNLDIHEKNSLPKTIEDLEKREKELQAELATLKAHRAELNKRKK